MHEEMFGGEKSNRQPSNFTTIHPRISVNSLCFGQASAVDLIRHWQQVGARRVSLVGQQLIQNSSLIESYLSLVDGAIETVAHVLHSGPLERDVVDLVRDNLDALVDAASTSGARSIYLLTGARGDRDWEAAAELFCETVTPCARRAKDRGVSLLVENAPFLFSDFHFVHSLRDAITLARAAGLGLCVDVYGCWTEAGLPSLLREAIPLAGIVQLSDYVPGDRSLPARAVPGDGAIPIRAIVNDLLNNGYEGAFDLELLGPRIEREGQVAAVRRAAAFVKSILET